MGLPFFDRRGIRTHHLFLRREALYPNELVDRMDCTIMEKENGVNKVS